jgi:TolB-like protein/Tfp pilus assembly protein PilF
MGLAPGTKLGPYEIQSPLGAGGMGEVYRATDSKLGRDVALKVLPAEMANDPERLGRFRREAKTLAQLDHPNIVTIHSVEECDGIHFLTMQLVEGLPLDRVIPSGGLSVEQIVDIASALGDALAAAHEKGIVHRDLKPANVMVSSEGRVKVLDFGLAKDVRANPGDATMTSASQTQVGVVMGTPAYMSPEQTSGRPLDHRTDIFSLGVLLHEMSTGERPFRGSSSAELVSAILRDTAPPVTDARPDLPSDLARVIRRCLEKDPRHRLQTARDVSNEFRDLARQSSAQGPAKKVPSASSTSRAAVVPDSGTARADEGFWVAVLPFKYKGSDVGLEALTEALSEEVITGLSRFSYLKVIARGSTLRFANQVADLRAVGKELGARYVMDGTLRQAGSKLRLAVQLVDTATGAHLWAENYERTFSPEAVFELQDDLVPRIVSTVADMNGVLPRSMSEAVRSKPSDQLSPYEAVLRSFAYPQRGTPEELAAARSGLEAALRKDPAYADAWAMLSYLCGQDYIHAYDLQPGAYDNAVSAARRAVELAPSNHLGYFSLAQSLWYQKDYDSFRDAAERAVALNPMDGNSVAFMGELLTYTGNVERGMELAERAKQLNPNHPGWYWCADFYHAFSVGDYRKALSFGQKAKLQGYPLASMFIATACGQLGDSEAGAKAAADLVKFRPELPALMRKQVAKVWNAEYGERFLEGLRLAGLEIPEAGVSTGPKSAPRLISSTSRAGVAPDSGSARADEGFWVAVLPFKYAGASADLKALADGLSDEVITGLSRFSYLRVIARGSTAKYSSESGDVRAIGKDLGARYVMEGSLRQAGAKVRIAVQLVDASTGAGLWAETYDRAFSSESMLDLLDDVVPRIVATVGDTQGILAHSMTEALRSRDPESFTPYEALLRSFGFHQHVSPAEHLAGRTALERAVKAAPDHAECWASLSWLYRAEYTHQYNELPNAMDRSLEAARRAVALAPSNQLAHAALASAFFFRKELGAFRNAAERALSLNKMEGYTTAFLAMEFAFSGDWERGCALSQHATQLNPHHPGWYWFPFVMEAYRRGDGQRALDYALKINMPGLWTTQVAVAAIYSQLGETEQAQEALRGLLKLRPDFGVVAREELSKWWQPELVEQLLGDLQKAGLRSAIAAGPAVSSELAPPGSGAVPRTGDAGRTASVARRADEGFWVAVLPFRGASGDADLEALADGLTEDVTTGLSRFPYLQIVAHNSAMAHKGRAADIRTLSRELGARYVIEGSIRKRGRALRVSAQLMDAVSGTQLWAEAYDREIGDAGTFQVQDDLTDHIVTSIADGYGVLVRSMAAPARDRKVEELSASELVLRHYAFMQQVDPQEHAALRAGLERALEREPNHATAWACLSNLYQLEYFDRFNPREKPLERAREAAWRAVKIDPACQMGWMELAAVHFLSRDFTAFRETAERAISLNPRDSTTLAWMAIMIAFSGDWERGVALTQRAIDLNRHHPGWYHNVAFHYHYRRGEYEAALQAAKRINMPEFHWMHLMTAASCGMLGRQEEARTAIESLRKYNPTFLDLANVREDVEIWDPDKDDVERLLQGLQKAGLKYGTAASAAPGIEPKLKSSDTAAVRSAAINTATTSGAVRADEGFWVAVLPFKHAGASAELKALADGVSEEVVTGLSKFSYLRVIARGSTAKYSSESADMRAIGKELGARYVMEGTLRQSGSKLRLAVQLVDAVSGAHLWAENYERGFQADDLFALQDDLVPRIVSTIADQYGILPRSMSEVLRSKSEDKLTPHEAVLRAFSYFERISPEEHATVRRILERAVEQAPDQADCWAMLSMIYRGEYAQGFNARPNALERALAAAQRAVDLGPSNHLAFWAQATSLFFQKDKLAFAVAAERSLALNKMDGSTTAFLGLLIGAFGDWDRGCGLVEAAMQLNPIHPGWYKVAIFARAYHRREYREALEAALQINMPAYFHTHSARAAAFGQLGEREAAKKSLQELLALRPDFAEAARYEYAKWYEPDDVEHIIDGLRKAGLDIPDEPVNETGRA